MGLPAVLEWAVAMDRRTDNPCNRRLFFISAFGHEDAGRAVQIAGGRVSRAFGKNAPGDSNPMRPP